MAKIDFASTGQSAIFPVLLCVADAARASWRFERLTKEYEFLRNSDDEDRMEWQTIRIDTGVFDANKGIEAALREFVRTAGRQAWLARESAALSACRCLLRVGT
jgi:hypothetical protein